MSLGSNLYTALIPGDILLTRNRLLIHNTSPGWLNHAALYVGDIVIEAQKEGIICSEIMEFIDRYPTIYGVRYLEGSYGAEAAGYARNFIGKSYKKWASLFRILKNDGHDNCVSFVRRVYCDITENDPLWKIPDDIYEDENIREIYKK